MVVGVVMIHLLSSMLKPCGKKAGISPGIAPGTEPAAGIQQEIDAPASVERGDSPMACAHFSGSEFHE